MSGALFAPQPEPLPSDSPLFVLLHRGKDLHHSFNPHILSFYVQLRILKYLKAICIAFLVAKHSSPLSIFLLASCLFYSSIRALYILRSLFLI